AMLGRAWPIARSRLAITRLRKRAWDRIAWTSDCASSSPSTARARPMTRRRGGRWSSDTEEPAVPFDDRVAQEHNSDPREAEEGAERQGMPAAAAAEGH